ncbi:MAG TPA: YigZ family protein [Ferruginibacter sp.]|nr:YigZ family protein [Ferruginibacter sp.]
MDYYFTIDRSGTAEFKDRGSRFIAHAFPIKDADAFKLEWQRIRKEHPKAVHHCFAYRLGLEGNQFRVNDDGEPSGSAGKPIMGQIDSRQLTNVAVIVTRYFGGTLLGVPGLINAYKTATALVLQTIPSIQKPVEVEYDVLFDYTQMNDIMQPVRQFQCRIVEQELQLFCRLRIAIPRKNLELVLNRLGDLRNVDSRKIL